MAEPVRVNTDHTRRFIEPADEHNQRLIDNVHPADWANPEPAERYHLVAVGAGTAGLVAAIGSAGLGAKVALIERNLMGGDCLNIGCVPSKGIIRAARAWHEVRTASERFGAPGISGEGQFAAAIERMRKLRADISKVDGAQRFSDAGVDVFFGDATFTGPDTVEVGGQTLKFRRAVIATGGRATGLPIPGLEDAGFLTNETLFELTELPKSLAVIGAGPIGCEMAQSFARFGTEVTLLDIADQVLIREDQDAALVVQETLEREGIRLELGVKTTQITTEPDGSATLHLERDGKQHAVTAERILLAVGRKPNIDGLGLEAAGVATTKRGIQVDDTLRTTNKRIFAAGDVAGSFQFTHAADAMARIVIQNALFFGRKKVSDLVIPWVTYTSPEIAHVGMYAADAKKKGIEIDTLTLPLDDVDRAILDGATEGFLRLHVEKGKDKVVGATLVADHAGDMLGELCLSVTAGVGLETIAGVIHPYPTQGEVVKKAADTWRRGKLTPTVAKIFRWWFRLFS